MLENMSKAMQKGPNGIIWSIITALVGSSVAGWASTVSIICFLGGVQLLSLGVIGEYIGKIYMETKHRPRFVVSDRTDEEKEYMYFKLMKGKSFTDLKKILFLQKKLQYHKKMVVLIYIN